MRGRRQTIASALTEALRRQPGARPAAMAAAFADACGPRLAQEVSYRGPLRDGRLLVLVRSAAWAEQVAAMESELCARVEQRMGPGAAPGLEIRVAPLP
jgi:predicted nucleic acid-binding Zn ribbon protein